MNCDRRYINLFLGYQAVRIAAEVQTLGERATVSSYTYIARCIQVLLPISKRIHDGLINSWLCFWLMCFHGGRNSVPSFRWSLLEGLNRPRRLPYTLFYH